MNRSWHSQAISTTLELTHSSDHGLTTVEAKRRLETIGLNRLPEAKVDGLLLIFLRQFESPLVYILLVASLIVLAMGEGVDGLIILAVLLFNAVVGTIQEGKAQNTLLALKRFVETKATVIRDGEEEIIIDTAVVPGDIILLQEGERVPADARLITADNLKVDESMLTGESESVHKVSDVLPAGERPIAEEKNLVFKGTYVVTGRGRAVVVATGGETVIGHIAREISSVEAEIPLKTNIRYLSRIIILTVLGINLILLTAGLILGESLRDMFAVVVSLSVSIIPEGLPIVMTLILATGVWRMSKRQVLVKRLQAVEALGQARVIAVDKTGTITKNEMTVQTVYVEGKFFEVGGTGYDPRGEVSLDGQTIDPPNHPELLLAGKVACLTADAHVLKAADEGPWRVAGDPTEAALVVFAHKLGFKKLDLEQESPLVGELPFTYTTKYHASLHREPKHELLTVTGAPEVVLGLSRKLWVGGEAVTLTAKKRQELESVILKLSRQGLRVIAFALKESKAKALDAERVKALTFVGFYALGDALRPEVTLAVSKVLEVGIKVVMITGDHEATAEAIARAAGIYREGDRVLSGKAIDALSPSELENELSHVSVFARVTPEHKLRLIQAYKARGEVVAMTGDGVNDAPSLVAADLGVAMGKIGTEVAKEAGDLLLLDDVFCSIVASIEEGRSIYKTIKKVILYLFSTSIGEVLVIGGAIFLGYPLPLLPAQIIWLNFVTDGFLDVALAMEPKEAGLLSAKFERPKKYLVDKLMVQRMFLMAIPMMLGTLWLFKNYVDLDLARGWTISLTLLAVFQWFNAWNCRSEHKSIFQLNPWSNKFLVGATIITILLQLFLVYNPFMQQLFRTVPLLWSEWLVIIGIATSIIFVEEIRKYFTRSRVRAI